MKITIIAFVFSVLASGCSKDDDNQKNTDKLPQTTMIGANTAGCYIDGQLLIPKNGNQAIGGSPAYGLNYVYGNNFWPDKDDYWQLEIANKRDTNGSGVILWIKNMHNGNGDYTINQSNGELYSDGPNNNQIIASVEKNGINKTYYSSNNSGVIKITRSDLAYGISIYSGTFSCTLYNKDNPSETIQITEGRFDINSLTLNN